MGFAVVACEPGCSRFWREPQGEVDGEMGVDAFGFHGFHNLDRMLYLGGIHLSALIEVASMDAHEINAVFGKHPGAFPQFGPLELVGRTVYCPKTERFPGSAVDELTILDRDESLLAGHTLVKESKVKGAIVSKGVGLGLKRKPPIDPGIKGIGLLGRL